MKFMNSPDEAVPHTEVMLGFSANDRSFNELIGDVHTEVRKEIRGDEFDLCIMYDGLRRLTNEDTLFKNSLWLIPDNVLIGTGASEALRCRMEHRNVPDYTQIVIYVEESEDSEEVRDALDCMFPRESYPRVYIGSSRDFLIGQVRNYATMMNPRVNPDDAPTWIMRWNNDVCRKLRIYRRGA